MLTFAPVITTKYIFVMANETKNSTPSTHKEVKEEKRHNPTWEAAVKYQPAFTFVAPEMFD